MMGLNSSKCSKKNDKTLYDLTNLATLKGWPLNIVFIDIVWGTVLTAIVSLSGFYIAKLVH